MLDLCGIAKELFLPKNMVYTILASLHLHIMIKGLPLPQHKGRKNLSWAETPVHTCPMDVKVIDHAQDTQELREDRFPAFETSKVSCMLML